MWRYFCSTFFLSRYFPLINSYSSNIYTQTYALSRKNWYLLPVSNVRRLHCCGGSLSFLSGFCCFFILQKFHEKIESLIEDHLKSFFSLFLHRMCIWQRFLLTTGYDGHQKHLVNKGKFDRPNHLIAFSVS